MADGRLLWFGESWGAPICDYTDRVEVPIGQLCPRCGAMIEARDRGLMVAHMLEKSWNYRAWHLDCWLVSILPSRKGEPVGG